jgi:hypothetical protein
MLLTIDLMKMVHGQRGLLHGVVEMVLEQVIEQQLPYTQP